MKIFKHERYVAGVKVSTAPKHRIQESLDAQLHAKNSSFIVTVNPEIILLANQDKEYKKILNNSLLNVADGAGVVFASIFLGGKKTPRITGTDLLKLVIDSAIRHKSKIFLLGGQKHVAKNAAKRLKLKHPHLHIVGAMEGPPQQEFVYDSQSIRDQINSRKPDILLVAFGAPKQERWIAKNIDKLSSVKLAIGVGGVFDFLSGTVKRAPKWMRFMYLEWLHRLIIQPKRIRRIFHATVFFPFMILRWKIGNVFFYRKNVVGIILNSKNQILMVTPNRLRHDAWQFPQGGIDPHESTVDAAKREMLEEIGVRDLDVIAEYKNVHHYHWPHWAQHIRPYKGQRQDLVIFRIKNDNFTFQKTEEIKKMTWVPINDVLQFIAPIRRESAKAHLLKLHNHI